MKSAGRPPPSVATLLRRPDCPSYRASWTWARGWSVWYCKGLFHFSPQWLYVSFPFAKVLTSWQCTHQMDEFWVHSVEPEGSLLTLGTGAGPTKLKYMKQTSLLFRSGCSLGFISGWADQRLDSITFHWRCPKGPQEVFDCFFKDSTLSFQKDSNRCLIVILDSKSTHRTPLSFQILASMRIRQEEMRLNKSQDLTRWQWWRWCCY